MGSFHFFPRNVVGMLNEKNSLICEYILYIVKIIFIISLKAKYV